MRFILSIFLITLTACASQDQKRTPAQAYENYELVAFTPPRLNPNNHRKLAYQVQLKNLKEDTKSVFLCACRGLSEPNSHIGEGWGALGQIEVVTRQLASGNSQPFDVATCLISQGEAFTLCYDYEVLK